MGNKPLWICLVMLKYCIRSTVMVTHGMEVDKCTGRQGCATNLASGEYRIHFHGRIFSFEKGRIAPHASPGIIDNIVWSSMRNHPHDLEENILTPVPVGNSTSAALPSVSKAFSALTKTPSSKPAISVPLPCLGVSHHFCDLCLDDSQACPLPVAVTYFKFY